MSSWVRVDLHVRNNCGAGTWKRVTGSFKMGRPNLEMWEKVAVPRYVAMAITLSMTMLIILSP